MTDTTNLTDTEVVLDAEIVDVNPVTEPFTQFQPTEATPVDVLPTLDNLTPEQQSQIKELQKRMELYNKSRSGHKSGDTHTMTDGVGYLVTKSGAYQRIGAPNKSRKATHRKEVAARRAGKS